QELFGDLCHPRLGSRSTQKCFFAFAFAFAGLSK
ncbi:hypothetical protein FOC1_g10009723, partial [Fusarium oxysporum f. sp. cubense race 1]